MDFNSVTSMEINRVSLNSEPLQEKQEGSIIILPLEMIIKVINKLNVKNDLSNCLFINKEWKELSSDPILFKNMISKEISKYLLKCHGTRLNFRNDKGNPLYNLSPSFKNDKEFLLSVFSREDIALPFASPELQDNETFSLTAAKKEFEAIKAECDDYYHIDDIEHCESYFYEGGPLKFVSERLKKSPHFMLEAYMINPHALKHADKELQNNDEFRKSIENIKKSL